MPASRRYALALCAGVLLPFPALLAQEGLRSFGQLRIDSEALSAPIVNLAAHVPTSYESARAVAMLRSDGRIVVQGAIPLADAPAAAPGTSYTQVVVGGDVSWPIVPLFGLALRSDGELVAWGAGATLVEPPPLPANTTYVSVSAGRGHAVALRSDGVAVAFGDGTQGQTTLLSPPAGVTVVQATAVLNMTALLRSDGVVQMAGFGLPMQPPVAPAGLPFTELWLGANHGVVRRSDGVYQCWGSNTYGQCNLPNPIAGTDYTAIGLGAYETIAVRSDGLVEVLGYAATGQVQIPPLPAATVVDQVLALDGAVLLRETSGAVRSYGKPGYFGPTSVPPLGQTIAEHSAAASLVVVTSGGELLFPYPDFEDLVPGMVPPLPSGVGYVEVASALGHTLARRSDGRVVGWGANTLGQLAIPPLPPGVTYTAIAVAAGSSALLRSDGVVARCGDGVAAILLVPSLGAAYVEVAATEQKLILLRDDGDIDVVGGSASQQNVPALPLGVRYQQVAISRDACFGLRSDGIVQRWGSQAPANLPPLPVGVFYVQIAAYEYSVAARRSDGMVVAYNTSALSQQLAIPLTLIPGESFVDLEVGGSLVVARFGPSATYVEFGDGCAGTLPASRLVPRDTPRIGRELEVSLFDLPQDLAVLVTGWTTLPAVPLDGLGMPGCAQHVSLDVLQVLVGTDGVATATLPLPNNMSLLGATFVQQAIVFDAAANAAGLVVSQATRAVVGRS